LAETSCFQFQLKPKLCRTTCNDTKTRTKTQTPRSAKTKTETDIVVSDISRCHKCQERFDYAHHSTV